MSDFGAQIRKLLMEIDGDQLNGLTLRLSLILSLHNVLFYLFTKEKKLLIRLILIYIDLLDLLEAEYIKYNY